MYWIWTGELIGQLTYYVERSNTNLHFSWEKCEKPKNCISLQTRGRMAAVSCFRVRFSEWRSFASWDTDWLHLYICGRGSFAALCNWRTNPLHVSLTAWNFTSQQHNLASSSKRKKAQEAVINKAPILTLGRLADGKEYFKQIEEIISGVIGSLLTSNLAEIRAPASTIFFTWGS